MLQLRYNLWWSWPVRTSYCGPLWPHDGENDRSRFSKNNSQFIPKLYWITTRSEVNEPIELARRLLVQVNEDSNSIIRLMEREIFRAQLRHHGGRLQPNQ